MKSTRCYPSRNQTSALFDAEDTSAESWLGVNCCLGARGALFVAVLMLLICTGSATSAAQSPPPASFVTAKMFQVGTGYGNPIAYYGTAPYDLAVGDFNNDGNLDIIAACWSAEVTVNLGNGDGTFQSLNHVYALPGAQGVAVGDFNGDGNLDAAVLAVGNPGSVIIFLGDGTGNLTQGASYPVGNQGAGTSNIAVGKLHVGGNLDLVVTNGSDNTVSVLLGNGDGTFQPQVAYSTTGSYPFNTFPQWVAIADVNKDGYLDLVTADAGNAGGGGISVLLGNGNGTFQAPVFYSDVLNNSGVGVQANGVAIADLNGDGNLDVVTAAWTGDVVNVFLGNGDGTFKPAVAYPVPYAETIAIADLNGKQDLIVADYVESTTWVLLGNGDGTFQPGVAYATDEGDQGLVVADFNGDGNLDFAVGNINGPFMTVALGNGDGTFRAGRNYGFVEGYFVNMIAAADLRNDGNLDIVEADPNRDNPAVHVMLGSPHGVLGAPSSISVCDYPSWVAVGDVNGDGIPDIVAVAGGNSGCGVSDYSVAVLLGNGDGTFQAPVYYSIGNNTTNNDAGAVVALAALEANGRLDIVVSNNDGSLSVLLNQGGGIFGAATVIAGVTGTAEYILTGDFNGDGKLDLALPDYINNTVKILLGNGDGTFQLPASVPNVPSGPGGLAVGDFNKDGKLDLAVTAGSIDGGGVAVLLGNGNGTFTFSADYIWSAQITGTNPSALAAADVNGDGNLDLLIPLGVTRAGYPYPNTNGLEAGNLGMVVLLGNGDGTFVEDSAGPFLVGWDSTQVVTGDFNNDGATDAAVLQHYGNGNYGAAPFVTMLINNTPPVSVSPLIVNYGAMTVGASEPETVILTNDQSTSLAISSITLGGADPGEFSANSNCGTSLLPGADCTITVTAEPTAAGAQTATLLINDEIGTQTAQLVIDNPAPTLTSLAPSSAVAGSAGFTLMVTGNNFVSTSVVYWAGSPRATTFVSATEITAAINAADVAQAGTFKVTVTNPAPGGGTSAALNFVVIIGGPQVSCSATNSTGEVGVPFNSGTVTVTGGTAPYTYSIVGTLPAGLTLNTSTGAVSGTPTASGTFSIQVTDANGVVGNVTCPFTINAAVTTTYTLSVTELGTGSGTVMDNQSQINCSEANGIVTAGSICSGTYVSGTVVQLTETSASFLGWGGACSGTTTCSVTMTSSQSVNASFAGGGTVTLTIPAGTNSTATAAYACPSQSNSPTPATPCTDSSAYGATILFPLVTSSFSVSINAIEVNPNAAAGDPNGLCPRGGTVESDFACRFVSFFNYGTDPTTGDTIVPLAYPYANGNIVHFLLTQENGAELSALPAGTFSGGVFLDLTFNNDTYTPTGYWAGSTPVGLIDPGSDEVPPMPWGDNCSTPMDNSGGTTPTSPPIYCQFDANVTLFYNPTEPVDSGVGTKSNSGSDFVVAFLPSAAPVSGPTATAPTIAGSCVNGCAVNTTPVPPTITFTEGTGGTFQVSVTGGYPPPTLTEVGTLPSGLTFTAATGLISGTPAAGTAGNHPITFTAANSKTPNATLSYTLVVVPASQATLTVTGPASVTYGTTGTATYSGGSGTIAVSFSAGSSMGCSVSGTTVNVINASLTCSLTATNPASGIYSAETSAPYTVTLVKANQTITFTSTAPTSLTVGATYTPTATATSLLTVTITLDPLSTGCTLSSGVVTATADGTCVLDANQGGNNNYNQAQTVKQSFPVTGLAVSPTSLIFGTTKTPLYPGQSGIPQFVTVKNTASTSAVISSVTMGGPNISYFGDLSFCTKWFTKMPGTLPAGASCEIGVDAWMVPAPPATSSTTPFTATANLIITPKVGSAIDVPLTTYVINPVATFSSTYLSSGKLTFPITAANSSDTVPIKVTNTGTTALILGTSAISGSGDFTVVTGTSTCIGATVAPAGACVISVKFAPTAKGTFTGTLSVPDNAKNSPQLITLSGTTLLR